MKKQFFRVKQLADQTFNRTGKTNGLSDDLQDADRKAEYIKNTCQNVSKRMSACLLLPSGSGDANAPLKDRKEKALKKSPEHAFAQAMRECSLSCDSDSALKICLEACSNTEQALVEDNLERDSLVDSKVVHHLQEIIDNEIPSIAKHKRNLTKACLDVDSAKQRYSQAAKHSHNNNPAGSAKADAVREELEECEMKLEQSRDALACEMFQLIVREEDLCHYLLEFYKYRRAYFQNALQELDTLIPKLETVAGDCSVRKVYGTRLEDHLRLTGRKIAYPIELCVCALYELGMEEEGLFRLAGGASKLKRMKLSLDAGCMTLHTAVTYRDPHVIAGCLKSYLRDLPEPLLTYALYESWFQAAKAPETDRLRLLKSVLDQLPEPYFDNVQYLIRFVNLLSKNQDANKMSPQNLAIVIAPNLIWSNDENDNNRMCLNALNATALYTRIVELLVINCDVLFPGEMEIYVTFDPVLNGDGEGIDNRGFDPRTSETGMKRSQSVNSLTDEPLGSPKPVMRKKNKPVAPTPPMEKPPRPAAIGSNTVAATATLPRGRPKPPKETKATDTDDIMTQSMGSVEVMLRVQDGNNKKPMETKESQTSPEAKEEPTIVQDNTEDVKKTKESVDIKQDLKIAKEKWFHGNDNNNKPALPDRPAIPAKPSVKSLRNTFNSLDSAKYENVSLSSNENLSGDERTLQRTQVYSIDKQQTTIIQVDKKRDRSREKNRDEKKNGDVAPSLHLPVTYDSDKDDVIPTVHREELPSVHRGDKTPNLLRKPSLSDSKRPVSLSVASEKPERPPKPDHFPSPSHSRTLSDGQIIDRPVPFKRELIPDGTKGVMKPCTSPPPPPVPTKPRAHSQGESTDF